jgi:hypothetical protein
LKLEYDIVNSLTFRSECYQSFLCSSACFIATLRPFTRAALSLTLFSDLMKQEHISVLLPGINQASAVSSFSDAACVRTNISTPIVPSAFRSYANSLPCLCRKRVLSGTMPATPGRKCVKKIIIPITTQIVSRGQSQRPLFIFPLDTLRLDV